MEMLKNEATVTLGKWTREPPVPNGQKTSRHTLSGIQYR